MYCRNCGAQNDDNHYKCTGCGAILQGGPPAPPPPGLPAPESGRFVEIPTYLATSILVTIFCCLPTGIVAIVYASQVGSLVAAGRYPEAKRASDSAKTWSWVSAGLGLVAVFLYFVVFAGVLSGLGAASEGM